METPQKEAPLRIRFHAAPESLPDLFKRLPRDRHLPVDIDGLAAKVSALTGMPLDSRVGKRRTLNPRAELMSLRAKIHRTDPYLGFQPQAEPDKQGWGSDHHLFDVLVRKVKPSLIIEIGSWKGASAIKMARACKEQNVSAEIVCVDTWLGSPGLYTRNKDEFYLSLKHINGYPSLYYTFLTNVVSEGFQDVVTPLPLPSTLAAETLAHFGTQADLIYIDAAHDYESALADIRSYWPLLKPNGVLFGDDYVTWPGVTKAANQFAFEVERPIYSSRGKFVIPKINSFDLSVHFG